jgi:hypothetical protein
MDFNFNIAYCWDKSLHKGITQLDKYYKNSDYYNSLVDGKPDRDEFIYAGILGNSHLYFQLAPGRFGFDKIEKTTRPWIKTHGKYCALIGNVISRKLQYPIDQEKILLWRGYIIKPNTFPYFKSHFLIMSSDFDCQNLSIRGSQQIVNLEPRVLLDMFDFYELRKQQGFLFYNGLIGNSQLQFHFHYTTKKSILKRILNDIKSMEYKNFKTKIGTNITTFKSDKCPCYNGTVFYGNKEQVAKDMFIFVKRVNEIKYKYNIIIIPTKNKQKFQAIVYIRQHVGKDVRDEITAFGDSGANYGNFVLKEVDDKLLESGLLEEQLFKYCKASYVKSKKKYFDL